MQEPLGFTHLNINKMVNGKFTTYQIRLNNKYGRKTIGVGSDYIAAINISKLVDEDISKQITIHTEIDIDRLKELVQDELAIYKAKKQGNIRVVEKSDLNVLWDKYVQHNMLVGTWCETTWLTTVASVTSIVNNCPIQKLEQKSELVQWLFSDTNRSNKTSRDRLKWIVSAIDWNSKHGNIPRRWGIEYRDLLESIKVNEKKKSNSSEDKDSENVDIFSVKEVYALLDALKYESHARIRGTHKQYYEYVYFLWLTGCRPSEAVALKWKNVDLQKNRITFCENQVNASGKIVCKQGTKTNDFRFFPINTELRELLVICRNRNTSNKSFVFLNQKGLPMSQQALNGVWRTLLAAMNIRYRVPYQLRHTMISYHANNDYPIHKLCEIVGNSEKIIKEHYLKLDIERINLPDVIKN
ncbi:site-specific integrase [Dolichospermum sp. ST_con]|nr:site-specific integrase [Dolichospermum sp. ST_con]MDD1422601.1 site-specific integrase [Dolichospermum sp. ST_sed1]MDD1427983.1 site-specific integrase [Dolichospermum sp. ST_sed9]MDD1434261.1 site-specific integrase [Dolichospermum sp. ST_sed6]MDD1438304.1 site-specific integrase [Dolichospermum sp. ST_sed10]MDD1438960.1 site-specific integrase [Dolichospermum sp. ST_sed3]MDD1449409.1 site-specific integrase [Dolichospermum sp. ST_sed8]MDD1458251.1 site-specific integrase [Dolichospermu